MSRLACKAAICTAATVADIAAETVSEPSFTEPRAGWEAALLKLNDQYENRMKALLAEIVS
jgi:hypothetical protein